MSALSVPVAVIGGITLYVGWYHLFIYFKRQIKTPVDRSFAITCFNMALYDVFCVLAYNASSYTQGQILQRLQVATLSMIGATYAWFVVDYAGVKSKRFRNFFTLFFLLSAVLTLTDNSNLTWMVDKPLIKTINLPLGLAVTYYEAAPGLATQALSLMGFLVFVYVFVIGLRLRRRGDRIRGTPLLWSCAFFCVGLCNDALVQSGAYKSVYLVEYTYMAIVLMMAYVLSLEVVRSAEVREAVERAYNKLVETSHLLTGSSEQVDRVTRSIDETIGEVYAGTNSQNDHIRSSHKTISDLLENIHAVSREAQQGADATRETARRIAENLGMLKRSFDRIHTIEASVASMWEVAESFSTHSKRIDTIAEFIDETASRINVLSLNAAIEASRSGVSGSGFMIIAREIRGLAKSAKARAEEITGVINEFQDGIARVKGVLQGGSTDFRQLLDLTGEGRTGLNEVLKLVEQEEVRLQRISSRMLDLRVFSQQVEKQMGTVAAVSERNLRNAEKVNTNTKEMSSRMRELAALAVSLKQIAGERDGILQKDA
jgi:methyl-accepting chemotaxis protein